MTGLEWGPAVQCRSRSREKVPLGRCLPSTARQLCHVLHCLDESINCSSSGLCNLRLQKDMTYDSGGSVTFFFHPLKMALGCELVPLRLVCGTVFGH